MLLFATTRSSIAALLFLIAGSAVLPRVAPTAKAPLPPNIQDALAWFDTAIAGEINRVGVPGLAAAVVYNDKVIYAKGFGIRKVGKDGAVNPDTLFQLASVSKALGATAIASLVSDGAISLDDPIVKHDPHFQLSDATITQQATIRDAYMHRTGLPGHIADSLRLLGYDINEIERHMRYVPMNAANFRHQAAYTNTVLSLGGEAAAKAVGKSWNQMCHNQLFKPAKMKRSTFLFSEIKGSDNRAFNHMWVDNRWTYVSENNQDVTKPGGGGASSANDLARWIRLVLAGGMLDNKRIISQDAITDMLTKDSTTPSSYAVGWSVDTDTHGARRLSKFGAETQGVSTAVALIPDQNIGVVVLTNAEPRGIPETLTFSFLEQALYGSTYDYATLFRGLIVGLLQSVVSPVDYAHKPGNYAPMAHALTTYAGTYYSNYNGAVKVKLVHGGLVIRLGVAGDLVYPLVHYSGDTFYYNSWVPGGPPFRGDELWNNGFNPFGVTFNFGSDANAAASITVEVLNFEGLGTLPRK